MSAKIYRANFEYFVKYNKASFPDAFEINGEFKYLLMSLSFLEINKEFQYPDMVMMFGISDSIV